MRFCRTKNKQITASQESEKNEPTKLPSQPSLIEKPLLQQHHRRQPQIQQPCTTTTKTSTAKTEIIHTTQPIEAATSPSRCNRGEGTHANTSKLATPTIAAAIPLRSATDAYSSKKLSRSQLKLHRKSLSESDLLHEIDNALVLAKDFLFARGEHILYMYIVCTYEQRVRFVSVYVMDA